MKTPCTLLAISVLSLFAYAQQDLPSTQQNWGPAQRGVRVALSLDKTTYAIGESIPLHIAAQIVSADRPLYGGPDQKSGAYFMKWRFANASI